MRDVLTRRSFIAGAAAATLASRAVFGRAEKPRIKLGQIGTTHAHANKLSVYRKSDAYEVVGIVEPDDKRWAGASKNAAYRDLPRLTEAELLATPNLQVVMIETDIADLVPSGRRCVDAGKHIHLDKPAGESLDAFRELLVAAETKKLIVQLGYMLRFSPATLLLRKLIADGALGDLFEVTGVMSKVVGAAERKKLAAFSGGMMFELGCHLVDLVVRTLGKPESVTPFALATKEDGLKDNCLAVFKYPKATATVRSTALEVNGNARRQFVVCGTEGTLRVEPLESPVVRLTLAKDAGGFKKGTQDVPMPAYSRYIGDAADMAAVLRGEKANDYSYAHDLVVHECVLRGSGMM